MDSVLWNRSATPDDSAFAVEDHVWLRPHYDHYDRRRGLALDQDFALSLSRTLEVLQDDEVCQRDW